MSFKLNSPNLYFRGVEEYANGDVMMTLTVDDVRKQGRNSVSKISLQLFDFSISQHIAVTFQTT